MGNIVKTAQCRFCGQMVQIETDKELTQPQAEEQATMTCNCTEAVEYQKEKVTLNLRGGAKHQFHRMQRVKSTSNVQRQRNRNSQSNNRRLNRWQQDSA